MYKKIIDFVDALNLQDIDFDAWYVSSRVHQKKYCPQSHLSQNWFYLKWSLSNPNRFHHNLRKIFTIRDSSFIWAYSETMICNTDVHKSYWNYFLPCRANLKTNGFSFLIKSQINIHIEITGIWHHIWCHILGNNYL